MKIRDRIIEEANCIIRTKKTIREIASIFNISKSTVHKDISDRLKNINYNKYLLVSEILKMHIETRHILGGESTKLKYKKMKLLNER